MEKITTGFDGLFLLKAVHMNDNRGSFRKLFNADFFRENQLETDLKEIYYSVSRKNVIRGMHFQAPPADHAKIVYVSYGSIKDVVVDLRQESPAYGHYYSVELDADGGYYLYIPKGFAHGFASLEEGTIVNYVQTSVYAPREDSGIRYDSFGFDWEISEPVVSERDRAFPGLNSFKTPFR